MTQITVIGAGIGGLTAAALLARRGYQVTVYDQAIIPGGCASTFSRRGFTFDVGATQVAGLEVGGIHQRIFAELGIDLPDSVPCDPACAVFLPGETTPINVWRDLAKVARGKTKTISGQRTFLAIITKTLSSKLAFSKSRSSFTPVQLVGFRAINRRFACRYCYYLPLYFDDCGRCSAIIRLREG
jgi:phytoene dehydrogenase-like protein